ncbi:adhesion G-protein coupled receptor G5-like isoform X1 [Arapaima gigas]
MSRDGPTARGVTGEKMGMLTRSWWRVAVVLTLVWEGRSEHTLALRMCGVWHQDDRDVAVSVAVWTGCQNMSVSANGSTLAIQGRFTRHCQVIKNLPVTTATPKTAFCLHWEPLLDLLELNMSGTVHTLCRASSITERCCTLPPRSNAEATATYGIAHGSINGDLVQERPQESYSFVGDCENCVRHFCEDVGRTPDRLQRIEELVMRSDLSGKVDHSCIQSSVLNIKSGFQGKNIHFKVRQRLPPRSATPLLPTVYLPPSLLPRRKSTAKVVCTLFNNTKEFQVRAQLSQGWGDIASMVVGISVEGEVVTNLPEPVRIHFYHTNGTMGGSYQVCCVPADPQVRWRRDGCDANTTSAKETVCSCSHLTYFALLLEVNKRNVFPHLETLTWITGLCCAISAISCLLLIVLITRQRCSQKTSHQSTSDHRGLALAMFLLCVLFAFAGVVANVAPEKACTAYGATLHWALLSCACWMAMEILHTFWLIYMVMRPFLKCRLQILVGFGLPILVVMIFSLSMDVYGQRQLSSGEDDSRPFLMCWIKHTVGGHLALNVTLGFFAFVVSSGGVMLLLVLRQVQERPEWKKNRVTFFSIWGLSLLFGLTWGLAFIHFGVLTVAIDFLFTIINSLQGFFLLLRFIVLERIRKQGTKSDAYSSSTGQQMLTASERG